MNTRIRDLSTVLYVLAEAVAWFAVLGALGTAVARASFGTLRDEIERGFFTGASAEQALAIARDGAEHATGGPSLLVVLLAAFGAFFLVRALAWAGFPMPFGAIVGLAASLVALQVLLHTAATGDLRVWEQSGLARLIDADGGSPFAGDIAAESFVADPDPARVERAALTITAVGLSLLWVRFVIAGRGEVTYQRALRSFSIGFVAVLLAIVVSAAAGSELAALAALAFFVLGALSLATAHAARTQATGDVMRRDAPWAVAVLGTLGGIAVVALLFGVLAALDVQRVLAPAMDLVLTMVLGRLMVILAPFLFALNWLVGLVAGGDGAEVQDRLRDFGSNNLAGGDDEDGRLIPDWAARVLRVLIVAGAVWLLYLLSRLLFRLRRHRPARESHGEARSASGGGGGGLASLLQGLLPRREGGGLWSGGWLRRHRVYELYARLVRIAEERGVERRQGDTPIGFARDAGARLEAPQFEAIGHAFDGARYGRHFPSGERVEAMDRELRAWERDHPPAPPDES